jgi:hypothetical protein
MSHNFLYDIENPKGIIIIGENIVDRNDTFHNTKCIFFMGNSNGLIFITGKLCIKNEKLVLSPTRKSHNY